MYLKGIALSGFKTFADDTRLELGPGITAIVGPNGSGKSNVVDGILWALGERSHKALRGQNATDVIFAGSAARSRVGVAEVSLFFDNVDRTLPLDFDEVQVSRRVFRDGESDYSINKTRSRLRDVTDLFLDTGIGPDSYTIFSQSEIDSILSARPEDRRGLLEGAAGVQKYRARRTETKRKLDKVETDLLRVFDITSELESQLEPLARQAELAREYDTYVLRLRSLQLAILARDYDSRQKRMEQLILSRDSSAETVNKSTAEIAEHEAAETQLEARLRSLEAHMDVLQTDTTEAVTKLKGLEGTIAVARERRRALTEQQEYQAQEIGLLRARITAATEGITEQREELKAAQNASSELSGEAAEAEAKLGAAGTRLNEATKELQSRQARVIELMRAGQKKREDAAEARANAASAQNRLADLDRLIETLLKEEAEAGAALTAAQQELEATKERTGSTAKGLETARENVTKAQQALTATQQGRAQTREKKSALASRLNVLLEMEQSREGVRGGARAVLQAVERGQLEDVYTLFPDAIRAPQELETAIEIALGGDAASLICSHDREAKAGINWLKNNRAGRATFLPIPNLRPRPLGDRARPLLRERGVIGLANELVSFDEKFGAAVDYVLGRVVIVEDLDTAVSLAKRFDVPGRFVTLEGEVVLPAGAVTGGAGKSKSAGLLQRKRELEEQEARVAELDAELQRAEVTQNEAQKALEAAQLAQRAAQEEANEARAGLARQEREAEHAAREARRIAHSRESAQSQRGQTGASVETDAARLVEWEQEAAQLDAKATELDAAVRVAQTEVAERQAERDEVAASVADVRANFGATQERLQAMRRAIQEAERQIKDGENQIVAKQAAISRAAGEDAALVMQEAGHVSALAELQKRRDELAEAFARGREARAASLESLQTTGTALRTLRAALHTAEDERHRVEIKIASTETEIAEITRRLEEEFETTVEDALPHRDDIEQKQAAQEEIDDLKSRIGALGGVNTGAIGQYEQVKERLEFLSTQRDDLIASKQQLDDIIADIDERTRERFMATFTAVQHEFDILFKRVFDGGQTTLTLTNPENLLETGIDLRVQPPGKGAQDISLLSGGERALTALAFMLALLHVHPSPFVVLDEVDAPLDQSNVGRFAQLLREFTNRTQFIVITHNNGTMQAADVLYGVTMQEQGVSKLVAVRLVDDNGSEVPDRELEHAA